MNTAVYMLRCVELGLSIDFLNYLSMGDVFDMLTERANDQWDYDEIATQEDINEFFRV